MHKAMLNAISADVKFGIEMGLVRFGSVQLSSVRFHALVYRAPAKTKM